LLREDRRGVRDARSAGIRVVRGLRVVGHLLVQFWFS
jgi:hypothetical protein